MVHVTNRTLRHASAEVGAMRRKLEEDRAALEAEKAAMVGGEGGCTSRIQLRPIA
jgi:hypothetical protein